MAEETSCGRKVVAWCLRHGIRVGGIAAILIAALIGGLVNPSCGTEKVACPTYALGEPLLLRAERSALALVILVSIFTVLWRVLIDGELPIGITRDGWNWRDAAGGATEALRALDQRVTGHEGELKKVADAAADAIRELAQRLDGLSGTEPNGVER